MPDNIASEQLESHIREFRSSLFFLRYAGNDYVDVEMDTFLIPNGEYATFDVRWNTLSDAKGNNVLRSATTEEQAEDKKFKRTGWERIYMLNESKPVIATGQMHIEVPIRYTQITIPADQTGQLQNVNGLTAELKQCENDVASVIVTGDLEKSKPIVVFYDASSKRLKTGQSGSVNNSTHYQLSCRAIGKIATVDIFVATDFHTEDYPVKATAKPTYSGGKIKRIDAPRFVDDHIRPDFISMSLKKLRKELKITAQRNYAWYGFNKPRIVLKLPRCDNSSFAQAKITQLTVYDSTGTSVGYRLHGGGPFDQEYYCKRFDIQRKDETDKKPIEYHRSVGNMWIRYPAAFKIITLTIDQPQSGPFKSIFENETVSITGYDNFKIPYFLPDRLSMIRGYDAQGRRLKKLDGNSNFKDQNGSQLYQCRFWGKAVRIDLFTIENWIELELPFDIPATDKLSEKQRGHRPVDY